MEIDRAFWFCCVRDEVMMETGLSMWYIQMDGQIMRIERLWIAYDVASLHVKIDKLNDYIVEFCFIRSID
jgi:hypothetical protein